MNKRQTKQDILDTAAALFFAEGYHVGVDRIIKEAKVAKMTFYKHFPSKTNLICAVISGTFWRINERVREMETDDTQTPLQQAHRIFDFLCDSMRDPNYLGALIPRALVEIADDAGTARFVARFTSRRTFLAIRRACLKAGTHGPMVGRQIHMVIIGGNLLSPIFGHGAALQAAKSATKDILRLAIHPIDENPGELPAC